MTEQSTVTKFPKTISPEKMRAGEQYLLAVRNSSMLHFETIGPFNVNGKAKRYKDGTVVTHFSAQVLMINECRSHPREELMLPLAGHSSIRGKRTSLHVYSEEVEEYFLKQNTLHESCNCKETD